MDFWKTIIGGMVLFGAMLVAYEIWNCSMRRIWRILLMSLIAVAGVFVASFTTLYGNQHLGLTMILAVFFVVFTTSVADLVCIKCAKSLDMDKEIDQLLDAHRKLQTKLHDYVQYQNNTTASARAEEMFPNSFHKENSV